jgi:hypothetical protein
MLRQSESYADSARFFCTNCYTRSLHSSIRRRFLRQIVAWSNWSFFSSSLDTVIKLVINVFNNINHILLKILDFPVNFITLKELLEEIEVFLFEHFLRTNESSAGHSAAQDFSILVKKVFHYGGGILITHCF